MPSCDADMQSNNGEFNEQNMEIQPTKTVLEKNKAAEFNHN